MKRCKFNNNVEKAPVDGPATVYLKKSCVAKFNLIQLTLITKHKQNKKRNSVLLKKSTLKLIEKEVFFVATSSVAHYSMQRKTNIFFLVN